MNEVVPIVTTKQNCETQNECIQIDSSAMEQIEKNCSKTVQGKSEQFINDARTSSAFNLRVPKTANGRGRKRRAMKDSTTSLPDIASMHRSSVLMFETVAQCIS